MVLTKDDFKKAMEISTNMKTKDNFDKLTEIVLSGASPEQISVIRKCTLDAQKKNRSRLILTAITTLISDLNTYTDEQLINLGGNFTTRKDFIIGSAGLLKNKLSNMNYFELTEHFES